MGTLPVEPLVMKCTLSFSRHVKMIMLNGKNLINTVHQKAILGNMLIGKSLEILPILCSLLTELFVLFSAWSYHSWTLIKYAHS